jgi:hypothetical protein
MIRIRLLALTIVLLAVAVTAVAQDAVTYLPLQVGHRWSYSSDLAGPDIKEVVSGPDAVFGYSYNIRYLVSDHSPGLENHWSTNADGDVFLHGFRRLEPRVAYFYDPPLKVVDAPLYPGKSWVSAVNILLYPGGPPVARFVVRYDVTVPETITVNGVEHVAHGVLETAEAEALTGIGSAWRPDGLPQDGGKTGVIVPHWWALGVGDLRYRSLGIFHLSDYWFGAVPNEASTWSDLKKLYR